MAWPYPLWSLWKNRIVGGFLKKTAKKLFSSSSSHAHSDDQVDDVAPEVVTETSHTNLAGHLKSPLFTKLPAELRERIYAFAFAGSSIEIELIPDWIDAQPCLIEITVTNRLRNAILASTCRAIHHEAKDIYWANTTIHLNLHYLYLERGPSLTQVLDAIPAHAKAQIRHISVRAQYNYVDRSRNKPFGRIWGMHSAKDWWIFLNQFPNLDVIQLPGWYIRPMHPHDNHSIYTCGLPGLPRKDSIPMEFGWQDLYTSDVHAQIVQVITFRNDCNGNSFNQQAGMCYLNYSTGKYWHKIADRDDLERGYRDHVQVIRRVLQPGRRLAAIAPLTQDWVNIEQP